MAKVKISEFSSTPGNNTDIDGINLAEGCAPSGINDAIRELMAQLKDFQQGTAGDSFNGPVGTTTAAAGAFTTLAASGAVTLSGGTANGVPYLNGSKVLTTGSALTFDGSTVTNTGVGYSVNNANALLRFGNAAATRTGYLQVRSDAFEVWSDQAAVPMVFGVSNNEQMRLTSTGLGIGTSSPGAKLDVRGTIQSVASGAGLSAISSSTFYYMNVSSTGLDTYTDANASAPMLFKTGGAERMRLDSSGNLGLGVTPSAWGNLNKALQLSGTGAVSSTVAGNTASRLSHGAYFDNTNWRYTDTSIGAARYEMTGANAGSTHAWFVSAGGTAGNAISFTQAMTLDASGRLGIGKTSMTYPLDVAADSGGNGIRLTRGAGTEAVIYQNSSGQTTLATTGSGAALIFGTGTTVGSPTERARIDSSGKLVVGNTTATNALLGAFNSANVPLVAAWSSASSGYTDALLLSEFRNYSPNNATARFSYFGDNAAARAVFYSNGGLYNYQANNVNLSDRREKTNFAPAKSYLETICAIPVQTFNYIDQNMEEDGGLTLGVVAQDVQAVAPELVMESNWGTEDEPKMRLSIYQTDLQYALMKAIQEQQAIIEDMKTRLAAAGI